ncbi:hypothetical protein ABZ926_01020 [Streptomyces litmocidini]|uniref:hypothetical protein n=1 Tax=Streptomyces litmocidini TaxID=67318 RepID=UPI0033ECC11F
MSGGLLMAVLLVLPGAAAWAGGSGDGALRMTVTVNGRSDSAVRPPSVRVGAQVVKRYRLENLGEARVHGVRVVDPGVPDGAVRCPRQSLAGLGEMECVARFRALPGPHLATARARGDVPSLGVLSSATARSGYTGVAGGLALTERVSVGGGRAAVTYTVANRGNRPLHAVRVEDTALPLGPGSVDCGGRAGTVALLPPGASARCTATVRRPPGTHRSTGLATGSDRVPTLDAGGALVPAPTLTARSSAAFTVPSPPRGAGGGGGSGGSGGDGGDGGSGVAGASAVGGGSGAGGGAGVAGVAGAVGGAGQVAGAAGAVGAAGAAAAGTGGATGAAGTAGTAGAAGVGGAPGAPAAPGLAPGAVGAVPPAVPPDGPRAVPPAAPPAVPPSVPRTAPARTAAPLPVGPPQGEPETASGTGDRQQQPQQQQPSRQQQPRQRAEAVPDDEGFLGRLRRRTREAHEFGVVTMLLLLLIPAAVAAALLGSRVK